MRFVKLLLLVSFLGMGTINAQRTKVEIILSDGTYKTGFAKKNDGAKKVKYRKSKKDKKEFIAFEEIDTLRMYYSDTPSYYVKTKIKDVEKEPLMFVTGTKEKMFLYIGSQAGKMSNTLSQNSVGGAGYVPLSHYYLRKSKDTEATYIGTDQTSFKKLAVAMTPFFEDCPALLKQIKERAYRRSRIADLVYYYNRQCETTK